MKTTHLRAWLDAPPTLSSYEEELCPSNLNALMRVRGGGTEG